MYQENHNSWYITRCNVYRRRVSYRLFGRICGKKSTSWMVGELVMNIVRRSIPIPSPDVGGIPYSSARTKSMSMNIASSSPLSLSLS